MNSHLSLMADDIIQENLLRENYAWVDKLLREKFYDYALTIDNYDEFCYAGLKEKYDSESEEFEIFTNSPIRKRSEDDISEYEENIDRILTRLGCQSPIPSNEYIDQKNNGEYNDYEYNYEEDYKQGYEEYYAGDVESKYDYYSD